MEGQNEKTQTQKAQNQKAQTQKNEKAPVGYEEILEELNFYKSLFVTNRRSMIGNLRIKTKKGERVWVDKINDFHSLREYDIDEEITEWLNPPKASR
tara:strand:- start:124 stop:414 length:291 start_codon:yes stop_codon:yes gene_type:complete